MNIILRNKKYYKVLSVLLNFPEKSDQELAELCDMERPTFNIIKNKLYKKRLLKHYYIPRCRRRHTSIAGDHESAPRRLKVVSLHLDFACCDCAS